MHRKLYLSFCLAIIFGSFCICEDLIDFSTDGDDSPMITKCNPRKVPSAALEGKVYFFRPNPVKYPEQYSIGGRIVIPSFKPKVKKYDFSTEYSAADRGSTTFLYGVLSRLDHCHKIRSEFKHEFINTNILVYVSGKRHDLRIPSERGLLEALMIRGQNVIVIKRSRTNKLTTNSDLLSYADAVSVCLHQLVSTGCTPYGKPNFVHVVAMGKIAHVVSTAISKISWWYKPNRITALDPSKNDAKKSGIVSLSGRDAGQVVTILTNMGKIGIDKPIDGCINIVVNDGVDQGTCPTDICSHETSLTLYSHAILNHYDSVAEKCKPFRSGDTKFGPEETKCFLWETYVAFGALLAERLDAKSGVYIYKCSYDK